MLSELLVRNNIILKKSTTIELGKYIKTRSLSSIVGVDLNSNNIFILYKNAKSKILIKDAKSFIKLSDMILTDLNIICKKRVLFTTSEICSKSVKFLKEKGWRVYAAL